MNRNTPAKHKTPNWKQVRHVTKWWSQRRNCYVNEAFYTWQPMPLRADRKDREVAAT